MSYIVNQNLKDTVKNTPTTLVYPLRSKKPVLIIHEVWEYAL